MEEKRMIDTAVLIVIEMLLLFLELYENNILFIFKILFLILAY
jgi:hypothetical protein